MWTLQEPWFEIILRGLIVFSFLFILARFWGKKHLGQMTAFDFILFLIISESVQNSLIGDDKSIPGGLIAVSTLLLMNVCINKLTFHSRFFEKILDGTPKLLIGHGKVDWEALNKEKITNQELHEALREEGVTHLNEVETAVIETNGKISVIKKKDQGLWQKLFH